MSISPQEVAHIAQLARLVLSAEEAERYGQQLGGILDYVADLEKVDTAGLLPSNHALHFENQMRADHIEAGLNETEVFQNSQEQEKGYFRVPQILQEGT